MPGGGRSGIEPAKAGLELRNRLKRHVRSIKAAAADIPMSDFRYRALVIDDAFIRLAETALLAIYHPIWNSSVAGFGNNAPGVARKDSERSRWDTLHDGRIQAKNHTDRIETRDNLMAEITQLLANTKFELSANLIKAAGQSLKELNLDFDDVVNADAGLDKGMG